MDWYKRYPASYRGDTWGLTLAEHGAYNLLLDHYYLTERPLPTGDAALASICGVTIEVWLTVKESVTRHFAVNNALMRHHKCDEVIDAALSKRTGTLSRQKAFVKRLKEKESITRYERVNNIPRGEERREEKRIKDSSSARADVLFLKEFEEQFWPAYPRKIGKGQARKAFIRSRRTTPLETITVGLARFVVTTVGTEPQFVCHPATWLNGERWNDESGIRSSVVATGPRSPPPDWDEAREGPWRPPVS